MGKTNVTLVCVPKLLEHVLHWDSILRTKVCTRCGPYVACYLPNLQVNCYLPYEELSAMETEIKVSPAKGPMFNQKQYPQQQLHLQRLSQIFLVIRQVQVMHLSLEISDKQALGGYQIVNSISFCKEQIEKIGFIVVRCELYLL